MIFFYFVPGIHLIDIITYTHQHNNGNISFIKYDESLIPLPRLQPYNPEKQKIYIIKTR